MKVEAVMESFQGDTTLEATCQKFGVSRSQLTRWRQAFQEKAPSLFVDQRNLTQKAVSREDQPEESPDECKKSIDEQAVQNEILQKVPEFLERSNRLGRWNWPIK